MADIKHIGELQPDPRNARKHNPRNIGMIVDALHEVGPGRSIVIDEDNNILAGNGTWEAAAQAGIEKVQIIERDPEAITAVRVRGLSKKAKKRLALYDNRTAELAEWEPSVLADEKDILDGLFTSQELDDLLASIASDEEPQDDPGAQIDRAAELQQKWQTERGQLWQIGRHRLLCGDSTDEGDVARLMGDERAEMVWTDPPYGVAVGDKNKYLNSIAPSNRVEENLTNDTLDEDGLLDLLRGAFGLAVGICRAGGAWYVAAPPGPLQLLFGQALKEHGIWRQTIQWVKNNATFSPLGVDYHWRAEPIFYGWLPNAGHRYYGGRKQDTVWEIDRPMKSPEHPTMKPPELIARALENSAQRGEIAYDPFHGSGSTTVAAEQTGRTCYGMEIEPKYVAVALERMAGMGLEPRLIGD